MRVDKYVLAQANRRNILDCIVEDGPINKAAIAQKVGLSIPSVMKIADDFVERGLVQSVGRARSSGGKPPELLQVIPGAFFGLGVDIGRSDIKMLLSDIGGNIAGRVIEPTGDDVEPSQLINRLCCMIEGLIARSGVDNRRILGIGVGMPGLIEAGEGYVLFSPDFEWADVALGERMQARLPYHIHVENANMAMARGELVFGAGRGGDNILGVNLGHGIGGAIIQKGAVYYGSNGISGEIGHMTLVKNGPRCKCGNRGCLEVLASGDAIARQAREQILAGRASALSDACGGKIDQVSAKTVFAMADRGDELCRELISSAAEYIGIALASCLNLLDVDRIVLCGGLTKNGPEFMQLISESIRRHQMLHTKRSLKLLKGALDDNATALGMVYQVIQNYILEV